MRKFLLSVAFVATNFVFGQINLEHSFGYEEAVLYYSDSQDLKYVSLKNTQITIYNSDYTVFKTFAIQIPAGFTRASLSYADFQFNVSKHLFNIDDKLEFFVFFDGNNGWGSGTTMIFNEDGNVIKDFNAFYDVLLVRIFHDSTTNKNKLKMGRIEEGTGKITFDVFSLPTSELTTREINTKNKLTAFPIPTKSVLKIQNPKNNFSSLEIFDVTGKLVHSKSFMKNENLIEVNVENLPKGVYMYKIGEQSSKFIKE